MGKKSNAKFIRKNSRIFLNSKNIIDLIEKIRKLDYQFLNHQDMLR